MSVLKIAIVRFAVSALTGVYQRLRRVRVLVHRAYFPGNPDQQFFINITNLSATREIEVVRVWYPSVPTVEVLSRPLPKRLKPDESWEVFVSTSAIHALELPYAEYRFRVRLSSGKEVRSRLNKHAAPYGFVPGSIPPPSHGG